MKGLSRCLVVASAGLVVSAASSRAQLVRGSVVTSPQSDAAVGAVVLLLDGFGDVRARVLTDDNGRFSIRLLAPATYRLRALRIGYQPLTTPPIAFSSDTSVVLRMSSVPADLPPVTTRERTQCNLHPDSALALGALWEDAKTALLAAAITREKHMYRFDLVDHVRTYDLGPGDLRSVSTAETQVYDNRTWASLPPEELRRIGYVIQENDSTTFVAPDIETLLSNYFVETHCFRLAGNPGPDSLLAVEFLPARRVNHAEVRGTLWIDKKSHDLRTVTFRYVNLLDADSVAGGSVDLARLASGAWVMTDWSIRAPVLTLYSERFQDAPSVPMRRASRYAVPILLARHSIVADQLRVYGGTLRSVWRDSVLIWSAPKRALDVRVTSGFARSAPLDDETIVYLPGTGRWVMADSAGSARFDDLVRGEYIVTVGTRQLDVLGWPRGQTIVEIGRAPVELTEVNLATPLNAARSVCGDDAKLLGDRTGVLIGAVTRDREAIGHREVTLTWAGEPAAGDGHALVVSRTVRTLGGDGRFLACGIPRGVPITVHVAGVARTTEARLAPHQVVGVVDISIAP